MSDLEADANKVLTDWAPSGEPQPRGLEPVRANVTGSSLDPSTSPPDSAGVVAHPDPAVNSDSDREPQTTGPSGPSQTSPGHSDPLLGQSGQPQQHPDEHSSSQPAPSDPGPPAPGVWCAQCQTTVEPTIPNHCPTCGGWVFENTASIVHGLRSKRLAKVVDRYRTGLIDQLFAERGGRDRLDVAGRISIENYALVCAQHKTIEERLDKDGLFTQQGRRRSAFDMLKGISETIDRLRAQLPPVTTTPLHGIDEMPQDACELAHDLLTRLKAGEQLSDFDQGRLAVLELAMRGTVRLPSGETIKVVRTIVDPIVNGSVPAMSTAAPPVRDAEPTTAGEARAEPVCTYCGRTCVGRDHHAYHDLHYNDPEERKKRDEYATGVMLKMMPFGHRY